MEGKAIVIGFAFFRKSTSIIGVRSCGWEKLGSLWNIRFTLGIAPKGFVHWIFSFEEAGILFDF